MPRKEEIVENKIKPEGVAIFEGNESKNESMSLKFNDVDKF